MRVISYVILSVFTDYDLSGDACNQHRNIDSTKKLIRKFLIFGWTSVTLVSNII